MSSSLYLDAMSPMEIDPSFSSVEQVQYQSRTLQWYRDYPANLCFRSPKALRVFLDSKVPLQGDVYAQFQTGLSVFLYSVDFREVVRAHDNYSLDTEQNWTYLSLPIVDWLKKSPKTLNGAMETTDFGPIGALEVVVHKTVLLAAEVFPKDQALNRIPDFYDRLEINVHSVWGELFFTKSHYTS